MEAIATYLEKLPVTQVLLYFLFSWVTFYFLSKVTEAFHYDEIELLRRCLQKLTHQKEQLHGANLKLVAQNQQLWLLLYKVGQQPNGEKSFVPPLDSEQIKQLEWSGQDWKDFPEKETTQMDNENKVDFSKYEMNPFKLVWKVGLIKTFFKVSTAMVTALLTFVVGRSLVNDYIKNIKKLEDNK